MEPRQRAPDRASAEPLPRPRDRGACSAGQRRPGERRRLVDELLALWTDAPKLPASFWLADLVVVLEALGRGSEIETFVDGTGTRPVGSMPRSPSSATRDRRRSSTPRLGAVPTRRSRTSAPGSASRRKPSSLRRSISTAASARRPSRIEPRKRAQQLPAPSAPRAPSSPRPADPSSRRVQEQGDLVRLERLLQPKDRPAVGFGVVRKHVGPATVLPKMEVHLFDRSGRVRGRKHLDDRGLELPAGRSRDPSTGPAFRR